MDSQHESPQSLDGLNTVEIAYWGVFAVVAVLIIFIVGDGYYRAAKRAEVEKKLAESRNYELEKLYDEQRSRLATYRLETNQITIDMAMKTYAKRAPVRPGETD